MPNRNAKQYLAFVQHDHSQCQDQLIRNAKAICAKRCVKLTSRRLQVLSILTQSHQPMGAYEILDQLNLAERTAANTTEKTQRIAAPIVYRALDFLLSEGLVHRIESKNAFVSCDQPDQQHSAQFLICSDCEKVAELHHPDPNLLAKADKLGFKVKHSVIEITGICENCNTK